MNEDQRRELLLLADGLETVPPERFRMETWRTVPSDCEFAGCAIGWAPILIPHCGLKFEELDGLNRVFPTYQGKVGIDAVSLYFGISIPSCEYLFIPEHYRFPGSGWQILPPRVAERIRKFLAIPQ